MEVILLERIEKLGQMGDVVNVKSGYARNYLLPQKKAMRANSNNQAIFEQQRAELEADNLQRREEAESVAQKVEGTDITIIRQAGDSGQLYGSVSARDIANSIAEVGTKINRNQVILNRPIKALGVYETKVALHPEVSINITVNIARTEDEAKQQLETGAAFVSADDIEAIEEAPAADATESALAIADDAEAVAEAAEGLVEEEVAERLVDEATADQTDSDEALPTDEPEESK
ncbi:MAG: 50S ribosomal protein L9 [Alphaproteobacteria bacterium]|jgi:large subunit ribosomal protein L9|nr:50S ribosomal protein L9 [Alphaproteobacteria bacterium]PPR13520.1 MAG: 50S ribosomal protein L9 [Alphaproteobacteria bacterium MarineAlpha12_Bin1]|tara:strand:+ start:4150 stop:4848 length:699 start_codon:yes stop_codon:yes gene_type:complete